MSITKHKIDRTVDQFERAKIITGLEEHSKKRPVFDAGIPQQGMYSSTGQKKRLEYLKAKLGKDLDYLKGGKSFEKHEELRGNIENYIGMTQVPTGVVGPMFVNGTSAKGEFYVPLSTSEGALVASYGRGVKACREAGWITAACVLEGVQRCPLFKFDNLIDLGKFVIWAVQQKEQYARITRENSRYAQLSDIRINIEGNSVIVSLEFTTGDAAGQNMVTICANKICEYIVEKSPVKPTVWFIESNYAGDKKATSNSFNNVRGKKVVAEIVIPRKVVEKTLKSTPEKMCEYWKSSTLAVIESGSIGAQGHVANGLTALFLACGQDVACVSEAAMGITRMEQTGAGDLYASVTLPNLIVGSLGGGTALPTQRECLELMDCFGEGKAKKLAEICASIALAGELSIAAAISAGHFAKAHEVLGRKKK